MEYRFLGKSGLKVSEISLGSWLTYGGYVKQEQAQQTIVKAYESGINFFDTANTYLNGEAEKVVGETLKKFSRSSYVLATKVWGPMGDGPNDQGLSRKHIMEQCHASLKRLNQDYVDIYYCHSVDPNTPMEETLRAMDDLVRQGKVLYVGVSNWSAARIAEAIHIADAKLLDRIIVNQPAYNMLQRQIENELIPVCTKYGIGQVVYSPLAQGFLSGKYQNADDVLTQSRSENSRGHQYLNYVDQYRKKENIDRVDQLITIANDLRLTLPQLALAWILRQSNISSALIGASRPEQVEENIKASGVVLSEDILQEIEKILINDC